VILRGDLDFTGTTELRETLGFLNGAGVLDMRAVRYVDCSALSEFVRLAKRAGPRCVTLIIATPLVRRVLQICEFQHLFRIDDIGAID
jgi:anti-anti-sigma factor